jgi:hypothetical protein
MPAPVVEGAAFRPASRRPEVHRPGAHEPAGDSTWTPDVAPLALKGDIVVDHVERPTED